MVSKVERLVLGEGGHNSKVVCLDGSEPSLGDYDGELRHRSHPHLPRGFELVDLPNRPTFQQEVFVTRCYSLHNEDLAIAKLMPTVNKMDFAHVKSALQAFLQIHEVYSADIQPCTLGDAYVRFNSTLERERFLGPVFQFAQNYQLFFVKHDEAENARSFDLDREAWVMLLGFPEDLRASNIIAKAVSGFGILVHIHPSSTLAHIIVKVYLNDDAKIPDSMKVNAGTPNKGRSWTVPVLVLRRNNIATLPDEEAFVVAGPLHPMPPEAPR